MSRIWKFLILISSIVIVDQLTKGSIQNHLGYGESISIVPGFFNITYVKNPGAAFGLGATAGEWTRKILFLYLPVLACLWLCVLIWKTRKERILQGLSYSLILAGAIGNLIDRFSMGYVVDFLDFYFQENHFPAFNVADSAITIAAGLLILDFILEAKREKNQIMVRNDKGPFPKE